MICNKCGSTVSQDEIFCKVCGAPIENVRPNSVPTTPQTNFETNNNMTVQTNTMNNNLNLGNPQVGLEMNHPTYTPNPIIPEAINLEEKQEEKNKVLNTGRFGVPDPNNLQTSIINQNNSSVVNVQNMPKVENTITIPNIMSTKPEEPTSNNTNNEENQQENVNTISQTVTNNNEFNSPKEEINKNNDEPFFKSEENESNTLNQTNEIVKNDKEQEKTPLADTEEKKNKKKGITINIGVGIIIVILIFAISFIISFFILKSDLFNNLIDENKEEKPNNDTINPPINEQVPNNKKVGNETLGFIEVPSKWEEVTDGLTENSIKFKNPENIEEVKISLISLEEGQTIDKYKEDFKQKLPEGNIDFISETEEMIANYKAIKIVTSKTDNGTYIWETYWLLSTEEGKIREIKISANDSSSEVYEISKKYTLN